MNKIRRIQEWFTGALERLPTVSATAALIAAAGVSGVYAQENAIEEITVTATKRPESAQDVPLAINAYGSEFLKESNIVGVDKLIGFTPGLGGTVGQDAESVITVRGIGTDAFGVGVDNSVGMFIDDVPVGRPTLIGNSFFDLERVEVVKGPQGTLFGRNASAGAISVITKRPDLEVNSVDLLLSAGNEGQQIYEVIGNLAASEEFGVRLAVRHDERDGTIQNAATGDELNNRDHTNIRLSALYEPSDVVSAFFSLESISIDTRVGFVDPAGSFGPSTSQNQMPSQDIDAQRYLAKITWDINDVISLTSNTSFMDYDLTAVPVDVDASELFLVGISEPQEGDQFVQEFRLNGSAETFDWFIGTSFITETIESRYSPDWSDFLLTQLLLDDFTFCDTNTLGVVCVDDVQQDHFAKTDNTSYAIYGDVAWNITDRLKLSFGARYTNDEKDFDINQPLPDSALAVLTGDAFVKLATAGPISAKDDWSSFDPRIALDYQVTDDVLVYGSVSSGYKSGGFNSDPNNTLASGLPQVPAAFNEESVTAYEIGLKSQFWENRARVNAAIYFNDYEDYQVEAGDLVILIENAADVESTGFEVDGTFLLGDNLTVMASYSYIDASFKRGEIESIDVSGRPLNRAPENSGSLVASYAIPISGGELTLRGDYIYTGDFVFASENLNLKQDSYGLFNARIGFESESGRWGIALIGENVGDEDYIVANSDPLGPALVVPATGALYRAEARFSF